MGLLLVSVPRPVTTPTQQYLDWRILMTRCLGGGPRPLNANPLPLNGSRPIRCCSQRLVYIRIPVRLPGATETVSNHPSSTLPTVHVRVLSLVPGSTQLFAVGCGLYIHVHEHGSHTPKVLVQGAITLTMAHSLSLPHIPTHTSYSHILPPPAPPLAQGHTVTPTMKTTPLDS